MRSLAVRRNRSGITMTEILISIMIMGVGLVSLATLFPVGLERIRNAQRASRSAMLTESAGASVPTVNMLGRDRFAASPWYQTGTGGPLVTFSFDPWMQDMPLPTLGGGPKGVYRGWGANGTAAGALAVPQSYRAGEGLPVAYDPLWWAAINAGDLQAGNAPTYTPRSFGLNGRFGQAVIVNNAGTPLTTLGVRNDPDTGAPSAHGLQRLDSLGFYNPVAARYGFPLAGALNMFTSQDDMVLLTANQAAGAAEKGSPVLPLVDLTLGNLGVGGQAPSGAFERDYSFSWMFTGRRSDVSNGAVYDGDVVIFHNRPFAADPGAGGVPVPAGERVVEAVFAYGTAVQGPIPGGTRTDIGYSQRERTVLLRWPLSQPDPDVRVGGWIADVTYERNNAADLSRFGPGVPLTLTYPGQRCHWYRVVRKGETENEVVGSTTAPADANYRRIVLTIETPVLSKTLLQAGGNPVHVNVALVSPYVVNVYPKVFTTR
jgi:hypothetical protein